LEEERLLITTHSKEGAYSKGGAYWMEGAKSNHYSNRRNKAAAPKIYTVTSMCAWDIAFPNFIHHCHIFTQSPLPWNTPPPTPSTPNLSKRSDLNFLCFSFLRRHIDYTTFFGTFEWKHVCFTWENNAGNWKLYINGELVKSGTGFQIGKVSTLWYASFSTFFACNFISIVRVVANISPCWYGRPGRTLHTTAALAVQAAVKTELSYRNDTTIVFLFTTNKN